jgi:3'-5' exoribonuclease
MARQSIESLQPQTAVDEVYRVTEKQLRANRQGNLYLLMQLADRTGAISGMKWNANQSLYDSFQKGDYLRVQAMAQLHNGNLQLIVHHFDLADTKILDPKDFDSLDREAVQRDWASLLQHIQSVRYPALRQLAMAFCDDPEVRSKLQMAPAGVKAHHAQAGGLLQHVVCLMNLVDRAIPLYPQIDRDLLLVGTLLHDIGKLEELTFDGELTYSTPGQLVGHLVQGVQMLTAKVQQLAQQGVPIPQEIVWRLEHMIVSHHGTLEHGSPRVPMTLEAIFLHAIDDLDAKLNTASELIQADRNADSDWTAYTPTFGRKVYKPSYVADQPPSV